MENITGRFEQNQEFGQEPAVKATNLTLKIENKRNPESPIKVHIDWNGDAGDYEIEIDSELSLGQIDFVVSTIKKYISKLC